MKRVALLAFQLMIALFACSPPAAAEGVLVGGTSSGMALLQKLAESYRQARPQADIRFVSPVLGSSGGLRALAAGMMDIAVSSRPPQAEEGPFSVIEYARTPFVFASSEGKQPQGFSTREVIEIYAGNRQSWSDGSPIRLVLRSPLESDTRTLRKISPAMDSAIDSAMQRKAGPMGEHAVDAAELIGKLPGSFGPCTLGLINVLGLKLNVLPLDGVMPSLEAMVSGRYPLSKPIFIVTHSKPGPATADFMNFLQSPTARNYLQRTGHLPGIW